MSGLFSSPKRPKTPDPIEEPIEEPVIKEAEEEAKRKERLLQQKKAGRAATILTSAAGAIGEASTTRKTLLGQ